MAASGLPYQPVSPRIVMSVEAYPGCWIHHVTVETADRIDKALPGWIREAYVFSESKR